MSLKLNNAARSAIKAALRGKVAGLDTMTKDALLSAAAAHGVDVNAIIAGTADTVAAPAQPAQPAEIAQQDAAPITAEMPEDMPQVAEVPAGLLAPEVQAEIDAINEAWRAMDVEGYKARIERLAIAAHKPAEVREVFIPAPGQSAGAVAHTHKRVSAVTAGELFGDAVKGAHAAIKLAVWDYPHAPKVDPFYCWPFGTGMLVAALFKAHEPVMLWGPKGTGKTSWAEQLAANLKRPFVRISCNAQTDAPTLVGMRAPSAEGGTEWKDGQLTGALRTPGCVLLIDEPSTARQGALYVLQSVLDRRELHIEETGEIVRAADGVIIILADNTNGSGDPTGNYVASAQMSAATIDRPEVTLRVSFLPADKEAAIIQAKTGCTPQLAALLTGYAAATRAKAETGDLCEGIGMRRLLSWARILTMGATPDEAAEGAFLDRAKPEEAEVLRQLLATHASASMVRDALKGREPAQPAPGAATNTGFATVQY